MLDGHALVGRKNDGPGPLSRIYWPMDLRRRFANSKQYPMGIVEKIKVFTAGMVEYEVIVSLSPD
jgi:hypothetical protein